MAENSQPSEAVARRSAANALLVVGFAYVSAVVTFYVAAQFEDGWGQLGMGILAYLCVPPAVLFFITQVAVRGGKAVGWAMLLTALQCGLLALFLVVDLNQSQWGAGGGVLVWITVAVLLSFHVRALLLVGRWSACPTTSQPATAPPPDFSWMACNQPLTDRVDSESPPVSQPGEAQPSHDDHKPLIDFRE